MKKDPEHTYVIRKIVRAKDFSQAIKKEKDTPVCEIILVIEDGKDKRQFLPAIGFAPREPRPGNDE